MGDWTYAAGPVDWQDALFDIFAYGSFDSASTTDAAEIELRHGTYVLRISSSNHDIDVAGSRSITNGTDLSFELRIGGKLVFTAGQYTSRTFIDLQPALDTSSGHEGVLSFFTPESMTIKGTSKADSLFGGASNDTIVAGDGNDTVTAGDGADSLDGGKGNDILIGGAGSDTYLVNTASDTIVEALNEGDDLVKFFGDDGTFVLGANIERLALLGDESISGIGNDGDNTLTGNSASNSLRGLGGNDSIVGGDGEDTLSGGTGNDTIHGGLENDVVSGGAGDDLLDGGRELTDDDDSYDVLSYTEDQPIGGDLGVTIVWSTASSYSGTATDNWGDEDTFLGFDVVRGSDLADTFVGSDANNWAEGMAGADTFEAGAGIDTFGYDAEDQRYRAATGHNAAHGVAVLLEVSLAGSEIIGAGTDLWGYIDRLVNVENASGSNLSDTLVGSHLSNHLMGHDGDDTVSGLAGDDRLDGDRGSDSLLGGDGVDTLDGGEGDDTLFGGAGADDLYGDTGDDILNGGKGRDRFHGGDGVNTVTYAYSTKGLTANLDDDAANTGEAAGDSFDDIDNLTGSKYGDRLVGDKHDNVLNGGRGADLLRGLFGNDTYIVNVAGDVVDERDGGGKDTVQSSISFNLNASLTVFGLIERLILVNAAGTEVTGFGNFKANVMDGYQGAGVAKLDGRGGNDTYIVGTGDKVSETLAGAKGGSDLVRTYVTFTLGANLENLTLDGTGAISGKGNSLNNVLTGNSVSNSLKGASGDDTLAGGLGNDTLKGGEGNDVFLFNTAMVSNIDTVSDFIQGSDRLLLDHAIFNGLGTTIEADEFASQLSGHAATSLSQRILYDSSNGTLWYDADGSGSLAAIQFAQLGTTATHYPGALSYTDFAVV